jgi:AcrR family transcriptional regulator
VPKTTQETIWTRPDRGSRGPQPEHTRAEIASAAVALADSGGLRAATMRGVAGALGTAGASLYRYLSSRDDLLDLMIDAALAELRLDAKPSGKWLDDLVSLAHDQLALYRRHPWLPEASLSRGAYGPHAMDYFEYCLRIMAPLRCATATKMEAIAMITGVVFLFAQSQSSAPTRKAPLFATATAERHPHLIAALTTPGRPQSRQADLFDRTLRSVLPGLLTQSTIDSDG